jgi:hypothetical protein
MPLAADGFGPLLCCNGFGMALKSSECLLIAFNPKTGGSFL